MRSATPELTSPASVVPTKTTSLNRSHEITAATSWMCISKSVCREMRCSRSPKPVNVGVKTECPSRRMRSATFRHCQPPPQVPCTSTKFVIVSIFPALLWRFCIEAAKNITTSSHILWFVPFIQAHGQKTHVRSVRLFKPEDASCLWQRHHQGIAGRSCPRQHVPHLNSLL